MSHDPSKVCFTRFDRARKDGSLRPWPKPPAPPPWVSRGCAKLPPPGPTSANGGRTPLEALTRLSIGTTYRTPAQPRAGTPNPDDMTTTDFAAGLGYVKDQLRQCLALAVACQTVTEWPRIQKLAAPLVLARLVVNRRTRHMVLGAYRYRGRLVLHDAFFDLVLLRHRNAHDSAKRVHIPERIYRALYREVSASLVNWAHEGASEARHRLGRS